ncbi:hypothetical protein GCM10010510_40610 [Streptomyces anandii JCM 4720]|nr:hypothetical protein GCM10010510_40610 [Streptomyces anandii JCM 4720]
MVGLRRCRLATGCLTDGDEPGTHTQDGQQGSQAPNTLPGREGRGDHGDSNKYRPTGTVEPLTQKTFR